MTSTHGGCTYHLPIVCQAPQLTTRKELLIPQAEGCSRQQSAHASTECWWSGRSGNVLGKITRNLTDTCHCVLGTEM